MRSIIKYFINNYLASNLLMVGLLLLGFIGIRNTKKLFMPALSEKMIRIEVVYPGASPQEIEEGIVAKIEEGLKGVSRIDKMTSTSTENSARISIEINERADIDQVLQDVKNEINAISSFPLEMESILVFKQKMVEDAINFAVSGQISLETLKKYARDIEEELMASKEVSVINIKGIPEEEIEISFRENDLIAYQISLEQATQTIRATNLNFTGGIIKGENEDFLLRAKNKGYLVNDFRNIILKSSPNGSVIRLHHIADIRNKWVEEPERRFINGLPAVVINVQYTKYEDLVEVAEKTKQIINKFSQQHDLIKITILKDESIFINNRIQLLIENGILGFLLVVLFLAVFLDWHLAFWVALSIPISFAGMFIFVPLFDDSINLISSFGMIMVLGILVDDGIVICESIYRKYKEEGLDRRTAAVEGTLEVLPAVTGAALTTILTFGGFFFIQGKMGDYFSSLAVFVILALVFSLIEGTLILPGHVAFSKALSPRRKENWMKNRLDGLMTRMRDLIYIPAFRFSIHNKFFTFSIILSLLILVIAGMKGGIIKQTFFPNVEINNVIVSLKMPSGTKENNTLKWLDHIETAAWEVNKELGLKYMQDDQPVIENILKSVGPNSNEGSLNLILVDIEKRKQLGMRKIAEAVRKKAGEIRAAESLTYGAFLNFGKPVSLALIGNESKELSLATQEVKLRLKELVALRDITDNNQEGQKEITISLNEKAKFLGLNLHDIIKQIRKGYFGNEVQRLQRARDEVKVWVRYSEKERKNIQQLKNKHILLPNGKEIPLSELVNLTIERGILNINRLDGKREIRIEADISDNTVSVSDLNANLKNEIIPEVLASFKGIKALFQGQFREQAKTNASLLFVFPVVLLLIFFVIALTVKSLSQTIIVFLIIPFCYIGVGWGHYIMDTPITLLSNQGALALVGILVNDTLVFISTYNQKMNEGQDHSTALYNAGLTRFRPIVLTSITTVVGLIPLLMDQSMDAQFVTPMAISIAFGLLFSTVIILLLLPVFLVVDHHLKSYWQWVWGRVETSYEVEKLKKVKTEF